MRIDVRLSERLKKISPSPTLAISAKAKKLKAEGKDIVSLAAGEPDFDTPDFIKEAGIEAIKSGFTKYTPTSGIPELKQAICQKLKKDNSLDYEPSQIVVSCGAKHSIFNALFVLLNKGDDVLIPSPYWVSYPEMVRLCAGNARFIKTAAANNFKVTQDELERHISAKTKVLILNSPTNPTGSVYSEEELRKIADICAAKRIFIISDEIYEKIIFDNLRHVSVASFGKDIYDITVTVNGVSKSFSMTGWRIGYLAAPQDVAEAVSKVQDHTTSNPASISQKASLAALTVPNEFCVKICSEFQKRRDYTCERLKKFAKISFVKPAGAFYIFCNISKTGLDASTLSGRLLEEALVSIIPGDGFGRDDYVRLSFATSLQQIEKGLDRIESWLKTI